MHEPAYLTVAPACAAKEYIYIYTVYILYKHGETETASPEKSLENQILVAKDAARSKKRLYISACTFERATHVEWHRAGTDAKIKHIQPVIKRCAESLTSLSRFDYA